MSHNLLIIIEFEHVFLLNLINRVKHVEKSLFAFNTAHRISIFAIIVCCVSTEKAPSKFPIDTNFVFNFHLNEISLRFIWVWNWFKRNVFKPFWWILNKLVVSFIFIWFWSFSCTLSSWFWLSSHNTNPFLSHTSLINKILHKHDQILIKRTCLCNSIISFRLLNTYSSLEYLLNLSTLRRVLNWIFRR